MTDHVDQDELAGLTADIVSAYVRNNTLVASDLPDLIGNVHGALGSAAANAAGPVKEKLTPAVPIKKSVTPDHIVCLEDGKPFKSLKKHIGTHHDLTPDAYREKWGLPYDYPMVAPNYAEARSQMAKKIGFGRKPAQTQTKPSRKRLGLGWSKNSG
ncbi:MAG: MucR family transcriptional regulator [bacterium]|nr:MucR family transcriptional regulator [bacterium]